MSRWKEFFLNFLYFGGFSFLADWLLRGNDITLRLISESIFIGFLFALLWRPFSMRIVTWIGKTLAERSTPTIALDPDENVLMRGPSNHLTGKTAGGGVLVLTDRRLIFKSSKLNFRQHEAQIPVSAIASASLDKNKHGKTFRLELAEGKVHRFVVESPIEWVRRLHGSL